MANYEPVAGVARTRKLLFLYNRIRGGLQKKSNPLCWSARRCVIAIGDSKVLSLQICCSRNICILLALFLGEDLDNSARSRRKKKIIKYEMVLCKHGRTGPISFFFFFFFFWGGGGLRSVARIVSPLLARKSSGFAQILPDLFLPEYGYLKNSRGATAPSPPPPASYAYVCKCYKTTLVVLPLFKIKYPEMNSENSWNFTKYPEILRF